MYPEYEKCKSWLAKNLPSEFSKLEVKDSAPEGVSAAAGEEKEKDGKRQKRGGKGMIKANKKKEHDDDKDKKISVSRAPRGKKKSVTVIHGLSTFGKFL